jgi:ATP-grasp domain, R2K clade family 3
MHLLYPSHPLKMALPDGQFAEEVKAIRGAGFGFSFFSLENFQIGEFRAVPAIPDGKTVLYRGWMLTASEYKALEFQLTRSGTRSLISTDAYLANHHLPQWYPHIKDLTPETRIYPPDCDLEAELRALNWPAFFIKDYVKSLKTSIGSRISKPEQVSAVVSEMRRFRGTVEGGFCVRRVEEFLPQTECRYFVMDAIPYAETGAVPEIVFECAKRLTSRFYSVDVVRRADGQQRIVEVGDGQVSDLVGWTPNRFATILGKHFSQIL